MHAICPHLDTDSMCQHRSHKPPRNLPGTPSRWFSYPSLPPSHPFFLAIVPPPLATNNADLTTGLNNQTLSIGLGTPDVLVLRGNAFPVIVSQDGAAAMMAAARVSDAGGKVVAFNKVRVE